jgi:hypothetical protein
MKEYYWVTIFNRNRTIIKQVKMERGAALCEFIMYLEKRGFAPLNDAFYYNKATGYRVIFTFNCMKC